jgi:NADH-quinone oxidoreductase subunit J
MNVNLLLLALLVGAALWTVATARLLRAAIGLALTSALLTMLMFQMDSPLAAAFELSVCAGLITVIFVSAISLTRPLGKEEEQRREAARRQRFAPVVGVAAWIGLLMLLGGYALDVTPPAPPAGPASVREVLWGLRRFDLLGQILVLFAGVFGVTFLFKQRPGKGEKEGRR